MRLTPKNVYEKSIVAFVDVLGFKDLVASGRVSVISRAMAIITGRLKMLKIVPNAPIKFSQFSDSLILSAPATDHGVIHLVHFTALLASHLCLNGIWSRGAVTIGEMYHKGNVAFGPALVEAWEIERELAIYPRILATYEVADRFVTAKNDPLPRRRHLGIDAYFRSDCDNELHLDIFSPKMFTPDRTGTITSTLKPVHRHLLASIREPHNAGVKRIQAKLSWLATYLRYVEQFHGAWHFTIPKKAKGARSRAA